ncbi:flagellar type III secretion system pore protein FliP [Mucisphaera calidilacus]|uniref:flagellar type III secretion system pore protein FliP n=1 Tax=Mucisphaera calidilacus TaxID=2527982 RepID=UPI001EEA7C55|nr:flagellar type III secretion system pore protein FliP [Mucisphaera calidilacus]
MRGWLLLVVAAVLVLMPALAAAQDAPSSDRFNPLSLLENASRAIPAENADAVDDAPRGDLSASLSIILLLTLISLAPSFLVMCTSFTRAVVVFALLRQALGTQQLPPSQVITGMALFFTLMTMSPVFDRVWSDAVVPYQSGEIDQWQAWERGKAPVRQFMFDQIEHADNWSHVYMVLNYRGVDTSDPSSLTRADVDTLSLVPAFMLSELKTAFLIGFRLYLPFLIIDMVVASVLISMGMLMLPPVLISLPFKLLLFVLVDGWMLVAGSLLNSFDLSGFL